MADEEETQVDARQVSLVNFLDTHVDTELTAGYQSTLRSLIINYGKAEYGRGYVEGARDER